MSRISWKLWMVCVVPALLGLLTLGSQLTAQETKKEQAKPAAEKQEQKERAKPRGRLPAFFATVVNEKQREEIYKIQSDYTAKLDELEKQLAALRAERDAKIDAVLTPEQLDSVNKKREEAKKRGEGKEETKPEASPAKAAPAKAEE